MKNEKGIPIFKASSIKGTTVKNAVDEKIGSIEDVMINFGQGEIAYVVVSVHTGFLNIDKKYFAIPWQAFAFETHQDDVVILNVEKDRLEKAPGFHKDELPLRPQQEFLNEVNTYYGFGRDSISDPDLGTKPYETQRENYEARRDPDEKESDFLG